MRAKEQIQEALKKIMDDGDAHASLVFKGYHCASGRAGWQYVPFGRTPQYLGRNLKNALDTIDAIADSRERE